MSGGERYKCFSEHKWVTQFVFGTQGEYYIKKCIRCNESKRIS